MTIFNTKWQFGIGISDLPETKYVTGVDSKLAYFTRTYVRGFVATRPLYSDIYVYHYVYICGVQPSADTSFSALMEYRR